ncbi:hypothetical protein Lxx06410 [Leifsonia xyli subsp. xyli str. CTCB07]|uniref:Uncharacterized protein n=1 Tax=Leifsonia xyli subsp. xyli (strain CTCB07) TaxID=281090 RepID=Q6AGA3_LEIXX|nr:hypothetical protein [Leifsonia xyli]AAT88592.1 hypothetical protein Lxx06410 [Leifsonia xyli subsp. xyli str. CTCB07]
MIGKRLSYLAPDGKTQTGVATGVSLTSSGPLMKIGDTTVAFSQIVGIDQTDA